ncbi:MAG: hypothetical protein IV092_01750 [Burkholderiaceae bacterium]|nr:hypothetical protein [Burkholderiaceae bacterium]
MAKPQLHPSPARTASRLRPRLALSAIVLAGCGVGVLALAGGSDPEPARPAPRATLHSALTSVLGGAETGAAKADPRQLADQTAELLAQCERPLLSNSLDAAVKGCAAFLDHPTLAARAHAATSSAYMLMDPSEVRKSAAHAEAATKLGNAAGKYLWAYHGLNGESGVQMEADHARRNLEEALAAGMPKASKLLAVIEESNACLDASQFRLLDQPAFCLLRPQLDRWLKTSGMAPRPSRQAWTDEYNPGAVLPDASSFEVSYDRDPSSGMYYPAAMGYRFAAREGRSATELLARLGRSLSDKYGPPSRGTLPPAPGSGTAWQMAEGLQIELLRDAAGELRVRYQHPKRVQAALAHAEALQTQRDEKRAELTRRAL